MSPLVGVYPLVRSMFGVVLVALATGRLWLLGVTLAVALLGSIAAWLRRTWSFDGELITLDEGVVNRSFRRVPVVRVQQVEISEPLLHRFLGLAIVRIATAGGATESGVRLDALARAHALEVRDAILAARAAARADVARSDGGSTPPLPPPPPEQPIVQLSTARIMLSGITSSTLLVVVAAGAAVLDLVGRLPDGVADSVEGRAESVAGSLTWVTGVVALVIITCAAAAVSAVAMHHDLTVVRAGDELRLRRGLFERRDAVVPIARVQAVVIRQNPAQRLLGMASVRVRSAGGAGSDDSLTIPLADQAEIDRLVTAATNEVVPLDGLTPAPTSARLRRITRRMPAAAMVAASLLAAGLDGLLVAVVAAICVVAAVALGVDAYANLGHRLDRRHLVVRWGSLVKRTVVVTTERIQSTRIGASPFQRRVELATMRLDLAGIGGTPLIVDQLDDRCRTLDAQLRPTPATVGSVSSSADPHATMGLPSSTSPLEES